MRIILSVLLFSLCLNYAFGLTLQEDLVQHLWHKFKETHGKQYLQTELESYRYSVFKSNVEKIVEHNEDYSKGLYTYRLGVNQFADMTPEEFRKNLLGTRVDLAARRDLVQGRFMRLPAHVKIPDNVDWREQGAVTEVKNQGNCGSCWAFSTTGSMEGAHFRLTGDLIPLSEQQLVDCSAKYNNEGCNGGLMDNAFQYIKENGGLESEKAYPYHARQGKCRFDKTKVVAKCTGFMDVKSGDEEALKEAVATVGPVSIAIDVTEDKFMLYKDGILVDRGCRNGENDLNHGVLVVGYGTNTTDDGKSMDFWIVKNSWGPTWGEEGYVRMARNMNNMCGVSTAASYPLVKENPNNEDENELENLI